MPDDAETPQVRVTFEVAAPLFQQGLASELEREGLEVVPGPPPMEKRDGREVVEVVRVGLQILGGAKVLEGTAESVAKVVRAINAAIRKTPTRAREMILTIYGPDNKPLKDVRVSEHWEDG
jgi:urease gamma subunit